MNDLNNNSNNASGAGFRSRASILYETTELYIETHNPLPSPEVVEQQLLEEFNDELDLENAIRPKGQKFQSVLQLPDNVIVQLIAAKGHVCKIPMADGNPVLAVAYKSGRRAGTYGVISSKISKEAISLKQEIQQYNRSLSTKKMNEILDLLLDYEHIEEREITLDESLMVFNNGVWHVDTQEFEPWEKCDGKYTFLAKAGVNYNSHANQKIFIRNPDDGTVWELEDWINNLFYNPDCAKTIWEIFHAILRPAVNYKYGIWFSNADGSGCNGKSTILEICRNLIGKGNYFSLPIHDWDKRFQLTELPHSMAYLTDETPVNERVERMTNYKLAITGDPISVEAKYGNPISLVWHGLTIMATNANPSLADHTGSLMRRLIIIPFPKNFKALGERGYIRDDYINRQEVLEYIAYKVAHMDVTKFTEYDYMKESIKEYTSDTKVVFRFMNEFAMPDPESGETRLVWDFCPFTFLYDLFREYYKRYFNEKYTMNYPSFMKEVIEWCKLSGQTTWKVNFDEKGKVSRERVKGRISKAEPLICEYELTNWVNKRYATSKDEEKRYFPDLKEKYTGIERVTD